MNQVPHFDELYVISDLHLGGEEGFQIFRQPKLLAGLIRAVGGVRQGSLETNESPTEVGEDGNTALEMFDHPAGRRIALLLNGDVVDFLAEPDAEPLSVMNGARKLEGIVDRFSEVFLALRAFLKCADRHLIIVLGNHDIELALPGPQEWLRQWLTEGDAAAGGRLTFATDGSGFRCRVGCSDVLCIHGEIADDWNRIDHQNLRKIAHHWKAGAKDFDFWSPCGGTKLVLNVMNDTKKEFPFVDLLKPETEAVVPILAEIDSQTLKEKLSAASALATKIGARAIGDRFLSSDGEPKHVEAEDIFEQLALEYTANEHGDARSILDQAEDGLAQGRDPVEMARESVDQDEMLSMGRTLLTLPISIWNRVFRGKSQAEALEASLRFTLADDKTFELDMRDEPLGWVEDNVADSIDFVICGHTHLERSISRGSGAYFNSGTWASLIRLTKDKLGDGFPATLEALKKSKTIEALELAGLAHTKPTVVSIVAKGRDRRATGQLHYAGVDERGFGLTSRPETKKGGS